MKIIKNSLIIFAVFVFSTILLLDLANAQSEDTNANPALEYCIDNGGYPKEKGDERGFSIIVCSFPNGSECEINEFFNGECTISNEEAVMGDEDEAPIDASEY